MKHLPIVFLLCLGAGALAGWRSRSESGEVAAAGRSSGRPGEVDPRPTRESLLTLQRERSTENGFSPLSDELRDWTDGELLAALEASLSDRRSRLHGEPQYNVLDGLLAEWMRRDFPAALTGLEKMEPGAIQNRMARAVASHWPVERGEEALEFAIANRERFPEIISTLILTATKAAAADGATVYIEHMRRLRESGFEHVNGLMEVDYPAGFDFGMLCRSEEFANLWKPEDHGSGIFGPAYGIVTAWHAQDREAAFAWTLENRGMDGIGMLAGSPLVDSKDNLAWIGAKFEQMTEGQRAEFHSEVIQKWIRFPSRLVDFAAGIENPAMLDDLRKTAVQSIFAGEGHDAMPLLDETEPARRIELLKNAEMGPAFSTGEPGYRPHHNFTENHEALLRTKLAEWDVGQEDTEEIISRFKP